MEQQTLLVGEPEAVVEARRAAAREARTAAARQRRARVRGAERAQVEYRVAAVEELLPATHRARAVWAFVERLELAPLYQSIRAREGMQGRRASDPKVLLALWLYATSQGVGSARQLAELCVRHDAYRWRRGGVPVHYHPLSDFRARHGAELDELLTQSLAVLQQQQLLHLRRVAQDGTKVRAAASRSSAHRRATLEECLKHARAQVEAVREKATIDATAAQDRRRQAAQERAARERQTRLEVAVTEMAKLERERRAYKRGAKEPTSEPRVSSSDATARKMRMGDGGYRLGYNVQLASTTDAPHVVVGVAVTQARTDYGAVSPMITAIKQRTEMVPEQIVVDAGFTSRDEVDAVAQCGVTLYGPLPERKGKPDPYAPQRGDSEAMRALKERMQTTEGQQIYRDRAKTAELVNADLKRWRTLERITVRGITKVTAVVLLNVLTFNMLRIIRVLSL